jgi:hypothetical protein
MKDNKSIVEKAFDASGVKQVGRAKVYGHDILFGDGFVRHPFPQFQRFGVEEDDYPDGCYVTCWLWAADDRKIGFGRPIFFDAMHDVGEPLHWRREKRLDTAKMDAVRNILSLKKARKHAN